MAWESMGVVKYPTLIDKDTPVVQTTPPRIYIYVLVVKCAKFAIVHNKFAACSYSLDGALSKISNINKTRSHFTTPGNKKRNKSIYIGWHLTAHERVTACNHYSIHCYGYNSYNQFFLHKEAR
jgi:hypothetical protein